MFPFDDVIMLSSRMTKTCIFRINDDMAADDLATEEPGHQLTWYSPYLHMVFCCHRANGVNVKSLRWNSNFSWLTSKVITFVVSKTGLHFSRTVLFLFELTFVFNFGWAFQLTLPRRKRYSRVTVSVLYLIWICWLDTWNVIASIVRKQEGIRFSQNHSHSLFLFLIDLHFPH